MKRVEALNVASGNPPRADKAAKEKDAQLGPDDP